jgi:hypothetical protein
MECSFVGNDNFLQWMCKNFVMTIPTELCKNVQINT